MGKYLVISDAKEQNVFIKLTHLKYIFCLSGQKPKLKFRFLSVFASEINNFNILFPNKFAI